MVTLAYAVISNTNYLRRHTDRVELYYDVFPTIKE